MSDDDTGDDGDRTRSEGQGDGHGQADDRNRPHDHDQGDGHGHGHDHGGDLPEVEAPEGDGLALEYRIQRFRRWLHEWAHGLWHGMVEGPAFEKIEKEAEDVEDEFLFACFADAFGIPSPVSYYTVELLPYMAEEFEQFERRMWDRRTLLERKGQQYHFH